MVKIGLIQTSAYRSNKEGIMRISKRLHNLGKKETDLVCLPEQWLQNNDIPDFDSEFFEFKRIAKEYSMTIIPGAFYHKNTHKTAIVAPIIGSKGEIIGIQEKIHPFDYERKSVKPGNEVKIFDAACKFGVIVCYDMVFPNVANTLVKKGANVLLSPSRIVKRGIEPWHMYVQVRALENRIPIFAANVENQRFGGNSIIVDLMEKNKVIKTKLTKLNGEKEISKNFDLKKFEESRRRRFSDSNNFH